MTIDEIKTELINKVVKLEGTHNVFQQGERHQCELVLLMISKLHQPTVISAVCNECQGSGWEIQFVKPCRKCKGKGKQTDL